MRRLLLTLTAFFLLTSPANAEWTWPVVGDVITPYRNGTDPYATGQHRGIDIAAPVGTAVVAATGGDVRFAGTAGSSGLTISIRTGDGYDTSYLHLSSLAVRAGAHVSTGERIGAVGTTGVRSATAAHLHFGVRDAGTRHAYHDPLAFLPPPPAPTHVPQPPAPAPAPAPEPAPPAAAPVTVPRRAPAPRAAPHRTPAPRTAPHRLPAPRTAPRGLRAPRIAPRGEPAPRAVPGRSPAARGLPAPSGAPGRVTAPGHVPHTVTAPGTAPRRLPDAGHAARGAARPSHAPALTHRGLPSLNARPEREHHSRAGAISIGRPHTQPSSAQRRPGNGPDIGWAAACAGLLLAAALLGLKADGPGINRRARSRLLGALPLLGRR
jgi:peptidase M23-like protein